MSRMTIAALFALAAVATGCGRKEPPKPAPLPPVTETPTPPPAPPVAPAAVALSNITIGNAVGADKRITGSPATLGTKDTIYASVDTTGSGSANLRAKWTYLNGNEATVVNEETLAITPTGPATTEFHISKPDAWPAGEYQVEIFVDDVSAGTKRFTVK